MAFGAIADEVAVLWSELWHVVERVVRVCNLRFAYAAYVNAATCALASSCLLLKFSGQIHGLFVRAHFLRKFLGVALSDTKMQALSGFLREQLSNLLEFLLCERRRYIHILDLRVWSISHY